MKTTIASLLKAKIIQEVNTQLISAKEYRAVDGKLITALVNDQNGQIVVMKFVHRSPLHTHDGWFIVDAAKNQCIKTVFIHDEFEVNVYDLLTTLPQVSG